MVELLAEWMVDEMVETTVWWWVGMRACFEVEMMDFQMAVRWVVRSGKM